MAGRAAGMAALVLIPALWACESQLSEPAGPPARLFRVTQADDQILPAHQECPAPVEGMVTGAHFVEGELILYPERTFTWRYTIEQYAAMEGIEQAWVEPITIQGTYEVRGHTLEMVTDGISRKGRLDGDAIELAESVPCHFPVDGYTPERVVLALTEIRE